MEVINTLVLCLLGVTAHSKPGENSASLSINFSGTVVPSTSLAMDSTPIEGAPGVSRVVITRTNNNYDSIDNIGSFSTTYLVFDPLDVLKDRSLFVSFDRDNPKRFWVRVPNSLVFIARWPDTLKTETVVAYFKRRQVLTMIASLNGKTKVGKVKGSKHP